MPAQFGYHSWLNLVSFKINLKYAYLFAKQEEEHKAYHSMASLFMLLQKRNYVFAIYFNVICLGNFLNYRDVLSCT